MRRSPGRQKQKQSEKRKKQKLKKQKKRKETERQMIRRTSFVAAKVEKSKMDSQVSARAKRLI